MVDERVEGAMALTVEMVGPMGVGKSVLTDAVVDRLREWGLRCPRRGAVERVNARAGVNRPRGEAWSGWQRVLRTPGAYAEALARGPWVGLLSYAHGLGVRPLSRQAMRAARRPTRWLSVMRAYRANQRFDVVVLDEGVHQHAATIGLRGERCSPRTRAWLADRLAGRGSELVVHVEGDVETVLARIAGRREAALAQGLKSWLFHDEPAEVQRRKAEQLVEELRVWCDRLERRRPGRVLRVDGRADLENKATRVAQWIAERAGHGVNVA